VAIRCRSGMKGVIESHCLTFCAREAGSDLDKNQSLSEIQQTNHSPEQHLRFVEMSHIPIHYQIRQISLISGFDNEITKFVCHEKMPTGKSQQSSPCMFYPNSIGQECVMIKDSILNRRINQYHIKVISWMFTSDFKQVIHHSMDSSVCRAV